MPSDGDRSTIQSEFTRTAKTFGKRTIGRFDHMGVVAFSRAESGSSICEVGAGTGNFLSLFSDVAGHLIAVDLTEAMLLEARRLHDRMDLVIGDGGGLPLRSSSIDLVACAQMLHHVGDPVPVLSEMARASRKHVVVVDQISTEEPSEIEAMNAIEMLRDPSHASSRPPSALRALLSAAGLDTVDEAIHETEDSFSKWMAADEFPQRRVDAVMGFVETRGAETGMGWTLQDGEWSFVRRRMMLLASPK